MITLSFINLALIVFAFGSIEKFLKVKDYLMLKQLALLEAALAGFLFMLGLIHFFNIMEVTRDGQTLLVVAGKQRTVQLFVLLGFGIIHLSTFTFILVKLVNKRIV